MPGDAQVVTDGQRAGIENSNAGTTPLDLFEQGAKRHGTTRHQLKAAVVTRQIGKFCPQKPSCIGKVKALELPIAQLMKQNGQRHQFRQAKRCGSPPLLLPICQQALLPFWFESLAKVIDLAKQLR